MLGNMEPHAITLHNAARRLLEVCDGAVTRDDVGFSRSDTGLGRVIAFTPISDWTPELAEAAAVMLCHYRVRQLADLSDDLLRARAALLPEGTEERLVAVEPAELSAASDTGELALDGVGVESAGEEASRKVTGRPIQPRLGFEGGVLTQVSPGYALPKATKRQIVNLLKTGGMNWHVQAGVHRLATAGIAGNSLPVGQVQALRLLRRLSTVADEERGAVDAYLSLLESKAFPTADQFYLRIDDSNPARLRCWVAFPYESLDRFKAALAGAPKLFTTERVGEAYQKGWWVYVTGADAATRLLKFSEECDLPCLGDARAQLNTCVATPPVASAEATHGAALAPPSRPELFMDGNRLVIPVPRYSPRFTDWIKATAERMAVFEKSPTSGPRWFIPASKLLPFAVLLDAQASVYRDCGLPPYAASIEVRRRFKSLLTPAAKPAVAAASASASLPESSVSAHSQAA